MCLIRMDDLYPNSWSREGLHPDSWTFRQGLENEVSRGRGWDKTRGVDPGEEAQACPASCVP